MSTPRRKAKRARSPEAAPVSSPAAPDSDSDSTAAAPATSGAKKTRRKKLKSDTHDDPPAPARSQSHAEDDDGHDDDAEADPDDGPVYDSCNEVRRKIRAYLRTGDSSIAAFLRDIGGVNSNSYRQFMAMKGPTQGSGNRIYPAAYHFFERRRVAEGKPKGKLRQESEAAFPHGYSLQTSYGRCWVQAGTVPVMDRIGRVSIVPQRPKQRRLTPKQLDQLLNAP